MGQQKLVYSYVSGVHPRTPSVRDNICAEHHICHSKTREVIREKFIRVVRKENDWTLCPPGVDERTDGNVLGALVERSAVHYLVFASTKAAQMRKGSRQVMSGHTHVR